MHFEIRNDPNLFLVALENLEILICFLPSDARKV